MLIIFLVFTFVYLVTMQIFCGVTGSTGRGAVCQCHKWLASIDGSTSSRIATD